LGYKDVDDHSGAEAFLPFRYDGIDACRPFEWRDKFPPAAEISAERRQAVMTKWKKELFS